MIFFPPVNTNIQIKFKNEKKHLLYTTVLLHIISNMLLAVQIRAVHVCLHLKWTKNK